MTDDQQHGEAWPRAELGPVARLRALAAGLPGVWIEEQTVDAPFDVVWGYLGDLERSGPDFDTDVAAVRVVRRHGDRLVIRAKATRRFLGVWTTFDVDLRPGWCWMVSRPQRYIVGMAAEPDGGATRFAHLEGFSVPGSPLTRALARPLHAWSRWRHRYHVPADVRAAIRRIAGG